MEKISENIKPKPQKVFDYYSGKLDPEEGKKIEEQLSGRKCCVISFCKEVVGFGQTNERVVGDRYS